MQIKDLKDDQNLQDIKVKLPEHIYEASSLPSYRIKNVPVYLMGWVMGDFFVKIDKTKDQIYPMFWSNVPSDIDDWEVITD